MRYFKYIQNVLIGSIFGASVLVGTASAQDVNREYRDWQIAQQRAVQEHNDYLRTGSMRDYNQWQAAERQAQEQYGQYQRATNRYGYGYNNNYNNGSYNNGYNNNGNTVTYRVYRNGSYYSTDYRGAELLRQAVRNGYTLGYQEGQRARTYRRGFNYSNGSAYRSGTYGYQNYVDRSQYRYYFQQGYQRGYEDGFNSTYRYGIRSNNGFEVLGSVLNTILNIAQ